MKQYGEMPIHVLADNRARGDTKFSALEGNGNFFHKLQIKLQSINHGYL